ncbi:MAG: two-component system cell cycle response regulator [Candidatus Azotimanducaceae bacterium]|jgi:two-component system cell cycle response regulator
MLLYTLMIIVALLLGACWTLRKRYMAVSKERDLAQEEARTEFLTGVSNLRGFTETVSLLLSQRARLLQDKKPVLPGVIVRVDVDRFKQVNDNHGHDAGDRLLCRVAKTFSANIRASDVFARTGGDEFSLYLSNTDMVTAIPLLERLVKEDFKSEEGQATFSIGITLIDPEDTEIRFDASMKQADSACYWAKKWGRDRVVHYT